MTSCELCKEKIGINPVATDEEIYNHYYNKHRKDEVIEAFEVNEEGEEDDGIIA